jgi:hypothetical protein
MNLAVSLSRPMIKFVGDDKPAQEMNFRPVIPAEGPIFGVGQDQQVACAEARSIFASLAAAPLFAAVGRRIRNCRLGTLPAMAKTPGRFFFVPPSQCDWQVATWNAQLCS